VRQRIPVDACVVKGREENKAGMSFWRISRERRDWCLTDLEEHLSEYPIRLLLEGGREDDRNTILRGLDINRLFVAIMDLD
jgi:hypothetical protein